MRILIADDTKDLADMLAELLADALEPAPETVVAYDGAQALALALERTPEVAVLDIDMPKLSGIEAAKAMRLRLQERRPVLIAVTGNASRDKSSGMRDAFDHVLGKPVDMDLLLALVRAA